MNQKFTQLKYFFLFVSIVVWVFYFLWRTSTYAAGVYESSYPTVYAKCALVVDATQSDCEALLDIYYGTRGTGWTVPAQLRWAFSGDATQTTIGGLG